MRSLCMLKPTRPNQRALTLLGALALAMGSSSAWAEETANVSETSEAKKMGASEEMGQVETGSEADLETARLHFSNGVNLLQESPPNYQDAWQQFRLALQLSGGSWKVRGNLGYCALKLERDGEALMHYRKYLEEGGDEINPQERADIERELLLLEGNMAWVTISSSDPEAEIAISRDGSSVPTQAYELAQGVAKLGLRAGDFEITATNANGKKLVWEPLLTPGKKASYHFDFQAPDTTAAPVAATASQDETPKAVEPVDDGPSMMRIVGFGALGVGVLAAGGGIITGVLAKNKEDQAKENCINQICPGADESLKNSAQSLATASTVLFIASGALAATGVTLVLLGGNESSEQVAKASSPTRTGLATLAISPGVAHSGGALFLSGTY